MLRGKRFSTVIIFVLILTVIILWIRFNQISTERYRLLNTLERLQKSNNYDVKTSTLKPGPDKNILIWTRKWDPLKYLGTGKEVLIKKKCAVQNCYITYNKKYLKDITKFDVIVFNGPDILTRRKPLLPDKRSPHQNYVYASIESADYYPACDKRFNNYFNITWTYKLDSDIFYGYVIIRDEFKRIIGPKKDMHWMNVTDMKPIDDRIKEKLNAKTKLAAWIVSNCKAPSGRSDFVKKVKNELKKIKGNWTVDIYGDCGVRCPRNETARCLKMVEDDYYFYFSFENSFAEDYVTEKVLHPLQHYTLPVVFGTANYTRFLPNGIYLNAYKLGAKKLAERMVELVNDKEQYYDFFKWMNHYSFHWVDEVAETDFHCNFCAGMNNETLIKRNTSVEDFQKWWNVPKIRKKWCPPRYP